MEIESSTRLLVIALRVGIVILAVIISGVSAGTISIIVNNDSLNEVRVSVSDGRSSAEIDLQNLINRSLGTACWLIFLGVGATIGESIAIKLAVRNVQFLVLQIFDVLFSIAMAFFYGATGIACAIYSTGWGEPPKLCDNDSFDCDDVALTATNALSAVFSFIQAAVLGLIVVAIIYIIVRSRKA